MLGISLTSKWILFKAWSMSKKTCTNWEMVQILLFSWTLIYRYHIVPCPCYTLLIRYLSFISFWCIGSWQCWMFNNVHISCICMWRSYMSDKNISFRGQTIGCFYFGNWRVLRKHFIMECLQIENVFLKCCEIEWFGLKGRSGKEKWVAHRQQAIK